MANYNSDYTGAQIDSAISRANSTDVTAGTVAASKAVVVDSSKDITGFRHITATGTVTAANVSLTGNVDLGDASGDTVTITGSIDSNLIPAADDTYDIGSSSYAWQDLFLEGDITLSDAGTIATTAGDLTINAGSGEIVFGNENLTTTGTIDSGTQAVTGNVTASGTVQGTVITATTGFAPDAQDGAYLGTSSLQFSDLFLADGAVVAFGDDGDVTLTHVADTGLLLTDNSGIGTTQLQFGDSGTYIYQKADGHLGLVGDTEIDISATTIDINGAVAFDGALTGITNITLSGTLSDGNYTFDTSGNVSGLGTVASGAITSSGVVTASGFTIGSAVINEAELETIDGITAGTVIASKAIVTDSSIDITGGRNITISGELDAATLDISGNADIDGTLEADAYTVDGTALATYIRDTVGTNMLSSNTESGITVTYDTSNDNIDFAVDAAQTGITSIYATDLILGEDSQTAIDFGTANEIDFKINNTTELTLDASALYPTGDAGLDLGTSTLEFKDAFFDGTVTSDAFAGPLTGDVTGTLQTAAQTNVTSLGTLTALTVDDVAINGKVITMTGSASDTAVFTAGTNGTLSIVTTDDAAAAANIQITADGTVDIDSAGVLTLDSGAAINIEPASGSAILLDGTISVDAGVVTGATSITSTAFVGDVTGTSSKATVTDSTANTNFPVVFHNESDGLLDDTGALRYNPSTGELLVPKLTVAGTTTTADTVTMNAANAVIFEGATADSYETTLSIVDPTADHTQYLINQGGYIPLLAAATTTAITSTPAELNILDDATVTTSELNIMDGSATTQATVTLAAGDGVVISDGDVMKQALVSDFEVYMEANLDTMGSQFTSASSLATVGALNSGSITSGFGTIDTGSSAITTTGLISGGSLDIDNVLINGTTIGHTDDTDLITLANGALTVAGTIGSGAITSTGVVTGTGFTIGSAVITEAELEMIDGITAGTAAASKAVVLDGSKNIATIGTIGSGAITATGSSSFATSIKTPLIEYTDGDDAITIADGGGITAANGITSTAASNSFGATAFSGAVTTNSTIDGIDIATRDGVLTSTTTTANAALPKAGGTMTGNIVMGDDTSIGISDSDERIEFDASGDISILGANLGVGVTAPEEIFHVQHGSNDSTSALLEGARGRQLRIAEHNTGTGGISLTVQDNDESGTTNSNSRTLLLNAGGGNVGIGTTSPGVRILSGGAANLIPILEIAGTEASENTSSPMMVFRNTSNDIHSTQNHRLGTIAFAGNDIYGSESGIGAEIMGRADATWDGTTNDYPTALTFSTTPDGSGVLAERMRITSAGNVGIGTAAPQTLLEIVGSSNATLTITNAPENEIVDGEVLGRIDFGGFDTTASNDDYGIGARIEVAADGVWDNSNNADSPAQMKFYVNNSDTSHEIDNAVNQKMTIDSSGNVGIGTTTMEDGALTLLRSGENVLVVRRNGSDGEMVKFMNGGSDCGSIDHDGSGTAYNTSSDYRMKENEISISDGLARLKQLKPYRFNFKDYPDVTRDGFFAHEVQSVLPYAVVGEKDAVDDDGEIKRQMIDQSKLVPLLVSAIQELSAKVTALENA